MISSSPKPVARPLFLGIEGGATHTIAILADARGNFIHRYEAGPANLKLLSDAKLTELFHSISRAFPQPDGVAIGMAGARGEPDWERIRIAASKIWHGVPCHATNDLETALAAAATSEQDEEAARVLLLSGTGSCCYGRNAEGNSVKVGGWGHVLGDKGSGYEIGLRALKAVVFYFDRDAEWPRLGRQLLHRLQLNEPDQLISWAQAAEKSQIAALATEVFETWKKGDKISADILAAAEETLVEDALACAQKLTDKRNCVRFILAGSILVKQSAFAKKLAARLQKAWPNSIVAPLERESVWGAVVLAQKIWSQPSMETAPARLVRKALKPKPMAQIPAMSLGKFSQISPTEQRNPLSHNLDKLPVTKAIELMLTEDAKIPAALLPEAKKIEKAVSFISQAFQRGGRLFYIGAGTSGRLGVLDASECPPTFRTDPELVQGIIAGGQGALWRSVEGAEDDPLAGARAIEFRSVNEKDVVVGIAASGRTPYVWGALAEAKQRGAKTVMLAFNPFLEVPGNAQPDLIIAPNLGPELLTGSTRLKAGTATKLILNIFTTLAMVRIGKVISNLMVDLNPSNIKLRDRAARIVMDLRNVDYETAQKALEKSDWVIKAACKRLRSKKSSKRVKKTG